MSRRPSQSRLFARGLIRCARRGTISILSVGDLRRNSSRSQSNFRSSSTRAAKRWRPKPASRPPSDAAAAFSSPMLFYEWRREPRSQTAAKVAGRPYLFRRRDGEPLALGGPLGKPGRGPNGEELDTACIITTAANGATASIHDRLPAIIEPESFDVWLDPDETSADAAFGLLRAPENEVLEFFEISPAINKSGNEFAGGAKADRVAEFDWELYPDQGRGAGFTKTGAGNFVLTTGRRAARRPLSRTGAPAPCSSLVGEPPKLIGTSRR